MKRLLILEIAVLLIVLACVVAISAQIGPARFGGPPRSDVHLLGASAL